jgi:hypothetical protein
LARKIAREPARNKPNSQFEIFSFALVCCRLTSNLIAGCGLDDWRFASELSGHLAAAVSVIGAVVIIAYNVDPRQATIVAVVFSIPGAVIIAIRQARR